MHSHSPQLRRAFTLFEVLTAIMIVGIVLPGCMYGISLASRLASQTRDRSIATSLGESQLNTLIGLQQWNSGPTSGTFSDQGEPNFSWQATVVTWSDPNMTTSTFNEIDLDVTWTGGGRQQKVSFSTVVYTSTGSTTSGLDSGTSL